jgi:hypothetical protein
MQPKIGSLRRFLVIFPRLSLALDGRLPHAYPSLCSANILIDRFDSISEIGAYGISSFSARLDRQRGVFVAVVENQKVDKGG